MRDTSPEIEKKMLEIMMSKSPEERVRMGDSMYQTARYIVACSILNENLNISDNELKKEVFLRFYGNDFSPEKRDKIAHHLLTRQSDVSFFEIIFGKKKDEKS